MGNQRKYQFDWDNTVGLTAGVPARVPAVLKQKGFRKINE